MPSAVRTELACLKSASRSARAYAERHLAALPQQERDRLQGDWHDTSFDGGYDFKQRWNAANWTAQEKHDATVRLEGKV